MNYLFLMRICVAALLSLTLISCASNSDSPNAPVKIPVGNLITKSACKSNQPTILQDYNRFEDVIEWEFANGKLTIEHINVAFNCCPGKISGNVKISSNSIDITENEENSDCDCNCLYDLTYEIDNLQASVYKLSIQEKYKSSNDPAIDFSIDLLNFPKGTKIFKRSNYPWI